jgi:eukaryotic-like serine/threonine-protein kinase
MSPSPGLRLGHYEVVELIGKGGMGEVYRVKDTRLPRDAAVKVSAENFTERFSRETSIIAGLNHPNICTLYDVGLNYLVMELIEGPTLADRIKEGPLSLAEASGIARQIADALEYAHERGVIHRDLKPGNIKIRSDGFVKVLDFGLAKAGGTPVARSDQSPTIPDGETAAGVIIGTAAYMSPEQARGKEVDKRSDIYAFGVVFYEMLSGTCPHKGDTVQETLASVLRDTPDLNNVPVEAHRLLKRCLEKDPQKRLLHIGDVMSLLDDAPPEPPASATPKTRRTWLWPAVAVLSLLTTATLGALYFRSASPALQEVRAQIPQPEGLTFNPVTQATISPDGRWLAFPALGPDNVRRMYARSMDSLEVKPLPGSEGITGGSPAPFWSWDSRFVVFGAAGKLKKAEVTGTPAQTIAEIGDPFAQGGTWSRDGAIVYASNSGNLMQVSAAGGSPVAVTTLTPGETAHRWPQFLPDGKRFLYQRVSGSGDKTGIYVGSVDLKPEQQSMQPLLLTDRQARWVAPEAGGTRLLLMQREATLLAQPFDAGTLRLSGIPTPVATGVGSYVNGTVGLWSAARNGTLVYRAGPGLPRLLWRDLTGKVIGDPGAPNNYGTPAVSPDGGRVAFRLTDDQGNQDIWVRDLARGHNTRLTFDPRRDEAPVWSPDGNRVIFAANRGGSMDLYEKSADGGGEERLLFKSDQNKTPTSWSRDGRFLLFNSADSKTGDDVWILPLDTLKPFVFLKTGSHEGYAQFSPDGRWIAYSRVSSGIPQVYVGPFSPDLSVGAASPASGSLWMVSTTNGAYPRWSGDGRRLFYVGGLTSALMAVDVQPGATFQYGTARRLFGDVTIIPFGSTLAGDRFVFAEVATPGPPPPFTLVLNWQAGLKK